MFEVEKVAGWHQARAAPHRTRPEKINPVSDGTPAMVDGRSSYPAERPLLGLDSFRVLEVGTAVRAEKEMGRMRSWVPQVSFSLEPGEGREW